MAKWELIILFMILLPIVVATECEISTDANMTWRNFTSIEEGHREGTYYGIQQDEKYCVRCRDDNTTWGYVCERTKEGLDSMGVSLIAGIGIMAALLFYFSYKLDKEHTLLQYLLIFGAMSLLILIPASILNPDSTGSIFYRLYLYVFVAFWIYVVTYFVYWLFMNKFRKIVKE